MSRPSVVIVDDGMGNMFNLHRALEYVGATTNVATDPAAVADAGAIVLPGVGAFGSGVHTLRECGLVPVIRRAAVTGVPILGICLGMQLLATELSEGGNFPGLDLIPGIVRRLHAPNDEAARFKVPQMGWNEIYPRPGATWDNPLMAGIAPASQFYFLHSYIVDLDDRADALAQCRYGRDEFPAIVRRDNVFGCQFHPERSGSVGLRMLSNFIAMI